MVLPTKKQALEKLKSAIAKFKENPVLKNESGAMQARAIVMLVIGVYLLAALLPSAITAINNTCTTGWSSTQTAIWGVVSVIILAVVIYKIAE